MSEGDVGGRERGRCWAGDGNLTSLVAGLNVDFFSFPDASFHFMMRLGVYEWF